MKAKFLAAAASVAFIATGVAAMAQENQKHGQSPAAATERAEPKAGGAMHEGAQAQTERRETTGAQGAGAAAHAEGQQNEMKGQGAERSRAAEAPGQQMKNQGAERSRAAEAPGQERKAGEKSATEQTHQQTPAARTGANEQHNGAKTGAAENKTGAAENKTGAAENKTGAAENKTGAAENKTGAAENKTGAAERDRNAPRTGANETNRANERTGANETNRNGARTAEQNGQHGQAQVRGNVHMSSEHATRVSETLRRDMQPEHVNVDIRVGERLPSSVQIRPLPQEVIAIVPEYRGYDYFIDENDEIVFVSPQSHEIVGMIQYEGRAASEDVTRARGARPCPTED